MNAKNYVDILFLKLIKNFFLQKAETDSYPYAFIWDQSDQNQQCHEAVKLD